MMFLHVKSEKGYMEDPTIPCSSPDYISDIIHHMQNVCNSETGQYHKYQASPRQCSSLRTVSPAVYFVLLVNRRA